MRQRTKTYLAMVLLAGLDAVRASLHEALVGEPVWVSSDGKPWRYSEMSDRHLRNSIKMLCREGEGDSEVCQALRLEEAKRAGERRRRDNYPRGF